MRPVVLRWQRFERLTDGRLAFGDSPCVYVQADSDGRALRVGKASKGLHACYRGGTGLAIDAPMHNSRNMVFVAPVPLELLDAVELALIWSHRASLPYNNVGKRIAPA